MTVCNILGTNVNVGNVDDVLGEIEINLEKIKGNYICVSNVHTTIMAYEDSYYRSIQNEAFMVLPDGRPLSILSKIRGHKNAERITGPDIFDKILKNSEKKGFTHYFYGSTQNTLDKLKDKLMYQYPNLNIIGTFSPPFRVLTADEDREIVETINKINPDFLWLGLGAPKQEIWMYEHKNIINSIMVGVGAAFDYHAGNIKRAPKFMQNLGLEWVFRLIQEPRRLWRRYFHSNSKFLFLIFKEILSKIS